MSGFCGSRSTIRRASEVKADCLVKVLALQNREYFSTRRGGAQGKEEQGSGLRGRGPGGSGRKARLNVERGTGRQRAEGAGHRA
jgi:hypothetical protein